MSLRTLTDGLFDHAGMFPPAALPFKEALAETARLPEALRRPWLMGAHMVVPLDRLGDLGAAALDAAGFAGRCRTCVVGVGLAQLPAAIEAALAKDGRVDVASVEASLPPELPGSAQAVLSAADKVLAGHGARLFVEPRLAAAGWSNAVAPVLALLEGLHAAGRSTGLKVRMAGPTALDSAGLAHAVAWAADLRVPFKATQGLHHPLAQGRKPAWHGFLSLAAALRLRQVLGEAFPVDAVQGCLDEQDPSAFAFDGLAWRGHRIDENTLRQAVQDLPFSVGSCSLREPDEDLVRLFGP